ncbi:MAG TPA: response regulator [Gemmatimonadales bacterium]
MPSAKQPPRILVTDDDESVRNALARFIAKSGYDVMQAENGEAALEILKHGSFAGMLCDIRMPGMTGVELLPQVIAHDPDIAIIMLTAVGDPGSAIQCLKLGATDYLIKPVELEELAHSLQFALRKRELEVERREMEKWLAREVADKTRELHEQSRQVELLSLSILMALVDAAEPVGAGARNHSMRVANLSAHVAAEMKLEAGAIEQVRLAARLHDLGRVAARDERLRQMTNEHEREVAAPDGDAPLVAARILEPLKRHADVVEFIRYQDERFDGKGRPGKRRGEDIPVGARIIAATKLYDQLTEATDSGSAIAASEAARQLRSLAGTMLDPLVVKALSAVLERRTSPKA